MRNNVETRRVNDKQFVFSIAASVALRRKGFGKSGFFVQFLGIIVEVILAVLEYAL